MGKFKDERAGQGGNSGVGGEGMERVNLDFIGFNSKIRKNDCDGEIEVFVQTHKMILSEEELIGIKEITEEITNKLNEFINKTAE